MFRSLRAPFTILALTALLAAPSTGQSLATPRAALVVLPAVAGQRAAVPADQRVVFRNDAEQTTRVVFHRRDAKRVRCDGAVGVSRSRAGQYTVQPGAELLCSLEPGGYRYETLTSVHGAIERERARIDAR